MGGMLSLNAWVADEADMANEFEELLKGQEVLGTMDSMSAMTTNKVLHMIFIVDISGSMDGDCIDNVNDAFHQMVPELQEIQQKVGDTFELYISILKFGSSASWAVTPTPILNYVHNDIEADGGGTDFRNAFEALKSKLTRKEFMAHRGKIAEPYIMFMTDGYPNSNDYEPVLDELSENLWYTKAQRYAVLIGEDAISNVSARNAVEKFASDAKEGIVTAKDAVDIVSVVSAKTIHTIKGMTIRTPNYGDEIKKSGSSPFSPEGAATTSSTTGKTSANPNNPFGEQWSDPSSLYGGNFKFF